MNRLRNISVTAGGILYLCFGAFHLTFFRVFITNPNFQQLVPFLSKITQMLNLGVIIFFISLGIVFLTCKKEILSTKLGKALSIMSGAFFIIRGLAELAFPKPAIGLMITVFACSLLYLFPLVVKNRK